MLRNRFLTVFALTFAAGDAAVLGVYAVGGTVPFLWAALCCVAVGGVCAFFLRGRWTVLAVVFGLLLGVLRCAGADLDGERYARFVGREDTAICTVVESASDSESDLLLLRVENSRAALPKGCLLSVRMTSALPLRNGEHVRTELSDLRLPTLRQRANGADMAANGKALSTWTGDGLRGKALAWFRTCCEQLYDRYGQTGIVEALLLRERSSLDAQTTQAYRNAGVAHLLAISGLHLAVFADLLRRFLRRFLPRGPAMAALCFALFGYCSLAGFPPSMLRAASMLAFFECGELLTFRTDPLTSLSVALVVLLAVSPVSLLSYSLQLSFLACLCLLLVRTRLFALYGRREPERRLSAGAGARLRNRARSFLARTAGSLYASCSVVLFTFPVLAFSFGSVSYLTPLANLLALPFFAPLLFALLLSVVCFAVFPPLAPVVAFLPGQALRLFDGALSLLDRAGVGSSMVSTERMLLPAAFAICGVLSLLLSKKRGSRLYFGFLAAFGLSLAVGMLPF